MLDSGHTAFLAISAALVLLMTPALAFFYGGLTRSKSTLNMMMMSFISIGVVSLLWLLYGFSLSFGPEKSSGLFGDIGHFAFFHHIDQTTIGNFATGVPDLVFAMFQLMFAIITVALISGSIADRAKFGAWLVFSVLWMTIVYFPVANWVFDFGTAGPTDGSAFDGGSGVAQAFVRGSGGWITNRLGALDFAGGTAVHINAGAAALALCLVLGKRKGWPQQLMRPHNVPFVLLGSGLLWFGWFGFNAGSALQANGLMSAAFTNTQIATGLAAVGWLVVERIRDGHATLVGFASGAVAGLVAITPSCGTVTPMGAMVVGLVAGALCCLAIGLKFKLGFDDSLDVVGVHLVGGIAGTLSIGFLACAEVNGTSSAAHPVNGVFYGGGFHQLYIQAVAAGAVLAYSFVVSLVLGFAIHKTIGFRITEEAEVTGIDLDQHGESAYDFTSDLVGATTGSHAPTGAHAAGAVREKV